ncbi:ATP-binding protein, partial [Microcoleus sp. herbarium5]|uniref:ATP-binding protein n=1 Tax=Microcoleus sp. herbarium5 TaxID=3055434 RepID=UPI002FD3F0F6
ELVESIKISYGKNHTINFIYQELVTPAKQNDTDSQETQQLPALDPKLLRHILTNLLSNAVKYSPLDSHIYFELNCQNNQEVTFKIKDAGIGIPLEDQEELFESYYRAKNVGKIPGTGLGLSIVKQCVELHRGQIEFSSEIGLGTTFIVRIPFDKPRLIN